MLETIKTITLINAYWFSFPIIGYAIFRFLRDTKTTATPIRYISGFALRQHPFTAFLLCFTLTAFLCAMISIPFYIFHWQVIAFSIIYLGVLSLSGLYLAIVLLRNLFTARDGDFFRIRNRTLFTKILFVLLLIVLLMDFLIALYIKSNVGGDTVYHMSRVVDILSNGFNIQSSFFNNLPEGAYHYNVIYALYAVPSKILQLEPIRVWEYSLGFWRLLQWLAIFTLAMHVFSKWLKAGRMTLPLSILSVISAVAFFAGFFFTATYPNEVVLIWLIILVICLSFTTNKNAKPIGIATVCLGLLITMTHPSFAVIATCFIVLLGFVRLLIEKKDFIKDRVSVLIYSVTIAVLMIGPIITKILPVRVSNDLLNLGGVPLWNVLGMYMKVPNFIPFYYRERVTLIMGIIATIYLFVKLRKRRLELSIAFALSSFFIIVAYVPPVFTILHYFLPVWLISVFFLMNVLQFVFIPIGLYGLFNFIDWVIKAKQISFNRVKIKKVQYAIFAILVIGLSSYAAPISYKFLTADRVYKKIIYSQMERVTGDFKDILKDEKLVVATPDDSYYLSAMFPVDVVAVTYGHTSLASDGANRMLCQNHIMQTFNYEDLNAVGAKYVLIRYIEKDQKIIKSKPFLKLIKSDEDFLLYEYSNQPNPSSIEPYKPCVLYQKNEKK